MLPVGESVNVLASGLFPRMQIKSAVFRLGRDDSCHPLLNAVHRLHVDAVFYLLQQGLSVRQRGTVHPYTGDNLTVSDVKGARRSKGVG
jgi:hypothetical protein